MTKTEKFKSKKERNLVSEYLWKVRDWKIRLMVENYLEASEHFRTHYAASRPLSKFPFKEIGHICNILYNLKEDHHLIFRRVIGHENIKQQDRHKIEPNNREVEFIANVGMLFHKILVARELKYIHTHYDPMIAANSNAEQSLIHYLEQIHKLFEAGVPVLLKFIECHSSNVLLLSLLFENSEKVKKSIGVSGIDVLKNITGQDHLEAVYFMIGKHYMESGWYDRAQKLLKKVIRLNPKHTKARAMLEDIKVKSLALKQLRQNRQAPKS